MIPLPARDLVIFPYEINFSKYFSWIISSRGCPYDCAFCCTKYIFGQKIRYRNFDSVVDEIRILRDKYSISHFRLGDDTLTISTQRTTALSKIIGGLNITWECFSRADMLTEKLAIEMYESGCRKFSAGIESGSERMLTYLKKAITLEDIYSLDRIFRKNKIPWVASIMIRFPRETERDLRQTFKLLKTIHPREYKLKLFSPYPGTELYNDAMNLNLIPDNMDWSHIRTDSNRYTFVHAIDRNRFLKIKKKMAHYINVYTSRELICFWCRRLLKDSVFIICRFFRRKGAFYV